MKASLRKTGKTNDVCFDKFKPLYETVGTSQCCSPRPSPRFIPNVRVVLDTAALFVFGQGVAGWKQGLPSRNTGLPLVHC